MKEETRAAQEPEEVNPPRDGVRMRVPIGPDGEPQFEPRGPISQIRSALKTANEKAEAEGLTAFGKAKALYEELTSPEGRHKRELQALEEKYWRERRALTTKQKQTESGLLTTMQQNDPLNVLLREQAEAVYKELCGTVGVTAYALAALVEDFLRTHKVTDKQARMALAAFPNEERAFLDRLFRINTRFGSQGDE